MLGRVALYIVLLGALLSAVLVLIFNTRFPEFSSLFSNAVRHEERLTADAWAIFDPMTGQVIDGENIDTTLPIASITKLFTAVAAIESGWLEKKITITHRDLAEDGRAGKLIQGEEMTFRELLFPLLIESSNDAGYAIARSLGPEYYTHMSVFNEAHDLTSTSIVDGSGIDPRNTSSARDLSAFFSIIKKNYPFILDITTLRVFVMDHRGLRNNDPAREFDTFEGGKQGVLPEAGKTFVGAFRMGGNREVGIVLLGSEDLRRDIETLLSSFH